MANTKAQTDRDQQLRDMRLSTGDLPGSSHGGYEIHYITEDNGTLCHECANRQNGSEAYIGTDPSGELGSDPQWHIVGHDCHWEGQPITCEHCNREIISEYGDPDDDETEDKTMVPKDFSDYAESVTYCNQSESGFGGDEGEWFYADESTLTIYTGTFANDHSPGASSYTYHDTYETREEFDARLAELEAMPEYLESDESDESDA